MRNRRSFGDLVVIVTLVLCPVGALVAGRAWAADTRLDDAATAIEKALVLLQISQDPGSDRPFGGHRDKAIKDLEAAQVEIQKAKEWSDSH